MLSLGRVVKETTPLVLSRPVSRGVRGMSGEVEGVICAVGVEGVCVYVCMLPLAGLIKETTPLALSRPVSRDVRGMSGEVEGVICAVGVEGVCVCVYVATCQGR